MLYFMKFKDLACNFKVFSFYLFLSQFLPDLGENYIKLFRENSGLRFYKVGSVLDWFWDCGLFWSFSNEIRSTKNIPSLYFVIIDNIFKLSFKNITE